MSSSVRKSAHSPKRTKSALERGKSKPGPTVKQATKVALKPKLSVLEAELRQARIDFANLAGSQARLLAKLHPLIDFYRTRWIELANMRNRLQRMR